MRSQKSEDRSQNSEPSARQVLAAVVHDARAELKLNNPDYRAIGRMFADGFEAINQAIESAHSVLGTEYPATRTIGAPPEDIERQPAEPEIHAAAEPELRGRSSRKGAKVQRD